MISKLRTSARFSLMRATRSSLGFVDAILFLSLNYFQKLPQNTMYDFCRIGHGTIAAMCQGEVVS